MAEGHTKLECLLAQSTTGALHLLRDFNNWRFCLRVSLQNSIVCFGPSFALCRLPSNLCHVMFRYRYEGRVLITGLRRLIRRHVLSRRLRDSVRVIPRAAYRSRTGLHPQIRPERSRLHATWEAALRVHKALGIERGIVVQTTTYDADHSVVLDALAVLGRNYRGCANALAYIPSANVDGSQ